MKKQVKNIAASVRARLQNIARENDKNFDAVLLQYFQERMLYRLSVSRFREHFILKGALLFLIYDIPRSRPTKDIDFLGVNISKADLLDAIKHILSIEVADGVIFDLSEIIAEDIKENAEYSGIRIHCQARLGQVRKRFHFDIGIGDKMFPDPVNMDFPVLLEDITVPSLIVYRQETAFAEKFEAIVKLGHLNSRMKDFYDIYHLAHNYSFRSEILRKAIETTFANRGTKIEDRLYVFADEFMKNAEKQIQWKAFLNRNELTLAIDFEHCVKFIMDCLEPLFIETSGESTWNIEHLKWM